MFYKAQKRTNYWAKIRKKAPKVPDITCPAIDEVITKIEKLVDKNVSKTQFRTIERKMEKLPLIWDFVLFRLFFVAARHRG